MGYELKENYEDLANAIIIQAVKDLRAALQRLEYCPDDRRANADIREIEEFFRSQYFELLTDLDGPTLLRKIREEAMPDDVHAT